LHPELLQFTLLGSQHVIFSYSVVMLVAMALGLVLGMVVGRRDGIWIWDSFSIGLMAIGGGVAGAVLLDVVVNFPRYLEQPYPPGLVWYGGLLGGIGSVLYYCRHFSLPLGAVTDAVGPVIAAGQCLGRVGCFLAGCCYGRPSSPPWPGVVFDHARAPATQLSQGTIPLHPVQLYEAAGLALICVALLLIHRAGYLMDRLFYVYLAAYALLRLGTETLRADPERGVWFGWFSTSQIIAVAVLAASVALLIRSGRSALQKSPK